MKIKYLILLIIGIIFLYSSITCVFLPPFIKINFLSQQPNIISHKKQNLNSGKQTNRKLSYYSEAGKNDNNFFNILSNKSDPARKEIKASKENYSFAQEWQSFDVSLPVYTKGIYLSNNTSNSSQKIGDFIRQAKRYGLNTFVMDVQGRMIPREIIVQVKKAGIFPVARIVVFEGGLKEKDISKKHLRNILKLISDSAAQGFKEIQLDYIRYADSPNLLGLSLQFKYNTIEKILKKAYEEADRNGVYLSADLFGRTTLHQHDQIGQRLELFAKYTQTIYPMLYPSHYTNDLERISKPYQTVLEGVKKAKSRLRNTRIVAYIQGFSMKIAPSGLSMTKYIERQIQACKDASADGWIIWNPRNQYFKSFQAIHNVTNLNNRKKNSQINDQQVSRL